MTRIARHYALLPLALLAGCALGPDFKSPETATSGQYTARPLAEKTAATDVTGGEAQTFIANKPVPAQWWKLFGSDKLNAMVDQALRANPTVISAQAALRVARETYRVETASLFPSVDASFTGSRQKIDTGSFGNPGGGSPIYNLFNASVGVSYGLDIWGGTRRSVEASRAATEEQAFNLEATYQTLIANLVTSAVEEAIQAWEVEAQKVIVADTEKQVRISRSRLAAGAIGRADLLLSESSLATERATLPQLQLKLDLARHQIAAYLGKLPSDWPGSNIDFDDLVIPQEVPLSLPSELVRQRPDVRAAEARLHQASANIGVATANLFPQISLNASYGTQASVLDQLFSGNIYSISGAVTQPIFHAGELSAKRRAAIATYDQAAADYRQTVLNAFKNVADTLRTLEADAAVLQANFGSAEAARGSLQLNEAQYKAGSGNLINVLVARTAYTQARAGYGLARASRYQDTAALFLALGGGWSQRNPEAGSPADPPAATTISTTLP